VYRRKIEEIDAFLERLGEVRAELTGKLADALRRQEIPLMVPDPCVVADRPSTRQPAEEQ
jgi:hypothetical protein